jgi:ssDNA thymidine ADP-ribosyltransferase, DarT
MSAIKARRLFELDVNCYPGTKVGEYVPFYFCPRSIMLFLFHRGNHPDLEYSDGQRLLVHLEADLQEAVQWAKSNNIRWAFSDRNAGIRYARFFKDLNELNKVNWNAVAATDFRDSNVKEGKQAEFLVYDTFPWSLVRRIGTYDQIAAKSATEALKGVGHQPVVSVEAGWYY